MNMCGNTINLVVVGCCFSLVVGCTVDFSCEYRGWEIYALENVTLYIAVYGAYKPYISGIHATQLVRVR